MRTIYVNRANQVFVPSNFTGMVVRENRDRYWVLNDQFHRINGPAYIKATGGEYWYRNGKWHRLDGLAFDNGNGLTGYYIDGIAFNEEDYWNDPRTGI